MQRRPHTETIKEPILFMGKGSRGCYKGGIVSISDRLPVVYFIFHTMCQ